MALQIVQWSKIALQISSCKAHCSGVAATALLNALLTRLLKKRHLHEVQLRLPLLTHIARTG